MSGTPEAPGPTSVDIRRVGPGGVMASDNAFAMTLLNLWFRVSEAGGAVGFSHPIDRGAVGAAVATVIDDLRTGRALGLVGALGRDVVGFAVLRPGRQTQAHTGMITQVMVDPAHQGRRLGSNLMQAVFGQAADLGLEQVWLGVRDGVGLDKFYAALGFQEVGRLPGWIRVAPGDDRDEVLMVRRIGPPTALQTGRAAPQ